MITTMKQTEKSARRDPLAPLDMIQFFGMACQGDTPSYEVNF